MNGLSASVRGGPFHVSTPDDCPSKQFLQRSVAVLFSHAQQSCVSQHLGLTCHGKGPLLRVVTTSIRHVIVWGVIASVVHFVILLLGWAWTLFVCP